MKRQASAWVQTVMAQNKIIALDVVPVSLALVCSAQAIRPHRSMMTQSKTISTPRRNFGSLDLFDVQTNLLRANDKK